MNLIETSYIKNRHLVLQGLVFVKLYNKLLQSLQKTFSINGNWSAITLPQKEGKGEGEGIKLSKLGHRQDYEQSLFFLLSASRTPARGNLWEKRRKREKMGTTDNLLLKIKRVRQATQSCDWSVPEIAVNGFFSQQDLTSRTERKWWYRLLYPIVMKLHQYHWNPNRRSPWTLFSPVKMFLSFPFWIQKRFIYQIFDLKKPKVFQSKSTVLVLFPFKSIEEYQIKECQSWAVCQLSLILTLTNSSRTLGTPSLKLFLLLQKIV